MGSMTVDFTALSVLLQADAVQQTQKVRNSYVSTEYPSVMSIPFRTSYRNQKDYNDPIIRETSIKDIDNASTIDSFSRPESSISSDRPCPSPTIPHEEPVANSFIHSRSGLRSVEAQYDISVSDEPIYNGVSPMAARLRGPKHNSIYAVGQQASAGWANTVFYRDTTVPQESRTIATAHIDANNQLASVYFSGHSQKTSFFVGTKTKLPGQAFKSRPKLDQVDPACWIGDIAPVSPELRWKNTKAFGKPVNSVTSPNLKLVDASGNVWAVFVGEVGEGWQAPEKIGTLNFLVQGLDEAFVEKVVVAFIALVKTSWRWEVFGSHRIDHGMKIQGP